MLKRVSGKPESCLSDTGLACALQWISTPQALAGHPLTDALFESAVCAELRKQMADTRGNLSFRDANPHLKIAPGLIIAPAQEKTQLSESEWALPWDVQ